jgi:5-methylcytosine-specific restriction protein A
MGTPSSPGKRIRGRRGVELRKRRLRNEPLCRLCKAEGIVRAAVVVDHIVPLAKGGEDVDANCRSLCVEHHDQVTREEFGHRERVTIGEDGWPCE